MTYNEEYVASMALTNVLTGLHILTTLDCVNNSVYLNAHVVLIENSIGAIANSLTDADDGNIGSSIVEIARHLVDNSGKSRSDSEGIRSNAIDAITKLQGRMMSEEFKSRESQNQEHGNNSKN